MRFSIFHFPLSLLSPGAGRGASVTSTLRGDRFPEAQVACAPRPALGLSSDNGNGKMEWK
jgi:hypothetical protein